MERIGVGNHFSSPQVDDLEVPRSGVDTALLRWRGGACSAASGAAPAMLASSAAGMAARQARIGTAPAGIARRRGL